MTDLMMWSGRCRDCGALMMFGADAETDEERAAEIENTWPGSYEDGPFLPDCIACDGRIDWNGSDPTDGVLLHDALLAGLVQRVEDAS